MHVIDAYAEFMGSVDYKEALTKIEQAGRVCYKSEGKIAEGSAETFVKGILSRGHEAVIEHYSFSMKVVCDRGVSHEIVRHRLASYCQESTRYCNYSKDQFGNELTFIRPCFWDSDSVNFANWEQACIFAESVYMTLLSNGATPQEARAVLPNSLKTEIVMTMNIREWRHFFKLRCSKRAHPQMREIAMKMLLLCRFEMPLFFEDIYQEAKEENGR